MKKISFPYYSIWYCLAVISSTVYCIIETGRLKELCSEHYFYLTGTNDIIEIIKPECQYYSPLNSEIGMGVILLAILILGMIIIGQDIGVIEDD